MSHEFKIGEHVTWNYEGGASSGVITEKVTTEIMFKGYVRHASNKDPQYIIKHDVTNHLGMHRGTVLRRAKKHKIEIK